MTEQDRRYIMARNLSQPVAWMIEPHAPARLCGHVTGFDHDPVTCSEPAILHAWFGVDVETGMPLRGYVCADHAREIAERALRERLWMDHHMLGDDCGMPGAEWVSGDPSRCESNGIPEYKGVRVHLLGLAPA